ncbi:MAG: radical SAM protein [Leptospirillia bacterium]
MAFASAYVAQHRSGALRARVQTAANRLTDCDLCARYCRVDRTRENHGAACHTGALARISSASPHHGEESPIRGIAGSGAIFFSHCNLRCVYCQNAEISQRSAGHEVTPEELAAIMLDLQDQGCHNINLVSPSHVVAQILSAVEIAAAHGRRLRLAGGIAPARRGGGHLTCRTSSTATTPAPEPIPK